MRVYYVAGPAHGKSELRPNPASVITIPEAKPSSLVPPEGMYPSICDWKEHTYRITRRTPQYCIAEWQPPKVCVRFSVKLRAAPGDYAARTKLSTHVIGPYIIGRHREDKVAGVVCTALRSRNNHEVVVDLETWVDGFDNATAIELASRNLRSYLEVKAPAPIQCVSVDAAVADD